MSVFKKILSWFQPIPSISVNELEGLLKKGTIELLDVRTSGEYRQGHIRQAKNVPLGQIASYRGKQAQTIYVICQSGARSLKASHSLAKQGYQVINVRGGMNAWKGHKVGSKK